MVQHTRSQRVAASTAARILMQLGPQLAHSGALRQRIALLAEREIQARLRQEQAEGRCSPGIAADQEAIGLALVGSIERALREDRLSPACLQAIIRILVKGLLIEQGERSAAEAFREAHGWRAPTFLVISPGKACNLRCKGCYADSTDTTRALPWSTVDRIVSEAKALWGTRFMVISGGEPFVYRSQSKGLLDLIEKHDDCLFMVYTNGTLIDEATAQRAARAGNILPAISLEGGREATDARRGEGVFDRVAAAMGALRGAGVPFGVSLTATRHNAEEILSESFIDYCQGQGALFGWIFQYMPIGRAYTLDLLPTPEQRVWMWQRSWEIVRGRRMFLADFWNHGTACDGCLSAGGHGGGGYFYIDWNGAVSPCVFLPYSPVNVLDVYARGGTLNDVWAEPFFRALREWQAEYKRRAGNGLAPCPIRDHHADLRRLIALHEPEPIDANAAAALRDPAYARGLQAYGAAYRALSDGLWETQYVLHPPVLAPARLQRAQEAENLAADS